MNFDQLDLLDVVVVDDDLPDMKGHDAVAVLKALKPAAAVIATASHNTRQLESSMRSEDVFFYHLKCFDLEELLTAVQNALDGARKTTVCPEVEPPRILVVDDDREFVAAVKELLLSHSYNVSVAYDRRSAFEKLASEKPDLVILDVVLDRYSDGFVICKKLRYDKNLRDIGVIVVSSVSRKLGLAFPTRAAGEPYGADCSLEKPVRLPELLRCVQKVLGKRLGTSDKEHQIR